MLIKCPKCGVEYKIESTTVPEGGLKMHCHACGEVFRAYTQDLKEEPKPKENSENVDLLKMFERVSKATNNLFSDSPDSSVPAKVRVIHSTHYKNTVNYFLVFLILALFAGMLYIMRYDVVRLVPNAEKLYDKMHVESIYNGTALQISNVKIEEIVVANLSKIKISGIINNPSPYEMFFSPLI